MEYGRILIVGVVGDTEGIPDYVVFWRLDDVNAEVGIDAIVSGKAKGVDSDAEQYANDHQIPFIPFPPERNEERYFFKRNKKIARRSEGVMAFVKEKYSGGAWNTIRHFVEMGKTTLWIYNERGELWRESEYPEWLQKKINVVRAKKMRRLDEWVESE